MINQRESIQEETHHKGPSYAYRAATTDNLSFNKTYSPLLVRDSQKYVGKPKPNSRGFSQGDLVGSFIGVKALTSLFTKKIDLKSQMKMVRRYKEELLLNHGEYIKEITRKLGELEQDLKDSLLLKRKEKGLGKEEERILLSDKDREEKVKRKAFKRDFDINESKVLSLEEEIKELNKRISDKETEIEGFSLIYKENVLLKEKEALLTLEIESLKGANSKKTNNFEELNKKMFEISALKSKISNLQELNLDLTQKLSQINEIPIPYSDKELLIEDLQKKLYKKEISLSQAETSYKLLEEINIGLHEDLKGKQEGYILLNMRLSEQEGDISKSLNLVELSEDKLKEKSLQYEELLKDFNSVLEEASSKEEELKRVNTSLRTTSRLSLTQEEDILNLKEKLENIKKSPAFKSKNRKLSSINEENIDIGSFSEDSDSERGNKGIKLYYEGIIAKNKADNEEIITNLRKELENIGLLKDKSLLDKESTINTFKQENNHIKKGLYKEINTIKELKTIIETHEIEIKELQQREGEYVQYITQVLNEQEKEKQTIPQQENPSKNTINMTKIKELELFNERLKEDFILAQAKIKEEAQNEINNLKSRLIEQNSLEKEIKRTKEALEKLKNEKEEVLWKENEELAENKGFIVKLKLEIEDLKKLRRQDEVNIRKLIKKQEKSSNELILTERSETNEEKKEKTKKTTKIIEKELLEKERDFLEELEELRLLIDFME